MKFADLLDLPYDTNTGIIAVEAILAAVPNTPLSVAQQFYADHGRKHDHQSTYWHLPIDQLAWSLIHVEAGLISRASVIQEFRPWFTSVANRAANYDTRGWECIDVRAEVRRHWAEHGTWSVPPVALVGQLVASTSELHVAEGHTRVGLLTGLVQHGVLAASSNHEIWLGTISNVA